VSGAYAAGRALADVDVIPGADLTAEAALAKLAYVIGIGTPRDEAVRMLSRPIRGEMTL
jgi:L-asparaginase/Glu-tRNA(Gln) amidotransferase subunit D